MVDIPEFRTQRKASSVVGTPGVDRSGERIAQTVKQSTDQVFKLALDAKIKKQDVADRASANKQIMDFELQSELMRQESHKKFQGSGRSTREEAEEINSSLNKLREDFASQIKSPTARSLFNQSAFQVIKSRNSKSVTQALERQTVETFNNTVEATDAIPKMTSAIFSQTDLSIEEKMDELSRQLDNGLAVVDGAKEVLSPEQHKELREQLPQSIAKAAVFSLLDTNPEQAVDVLNSGEFDDQFTPEEKQKLLKDANDYLGQKQALGKKIKLEGQEQNERGLATRVAEGDIPSEAEIQQMLVNEDITDGYAKALNNLKKSKDAVFAGDNPRRFNELIAEFNTLGITEQGETDATFGQLSRFRQRVLEAHASGEINKETMTRWMKHVEPKFNEGVQDLFKELNKKKKNGFDLFGLWTDQHLEDEDEIAEGKMAMQLELMRRIDEEENQQRITGRRVNQMAKEILDDFIIEKNPNRTRFEKDQVINTGKGFVRIVGFDTDGDPIITLAI